jgi:hypothetical protein
MRRSTRTGSEIPRRIVVPGHVLTGVRAAIGMI